jgi:uncharacterized lipoprotein YmbA
MKMSRLALGFSMLLAGCASGPPIRTFLLGAPARADGPQPANGALVQLQTVLVPDYLDTTDILTRTGPHEVVASSTGRWGERLSQGITHALEGDLDARLKSSHLTLNPPANPLSSQLLVTVDAFDAWPDGHCVLTAHWTILRISTDSNGLTGQGSFKSPPMPNADDTARVAAMANAVSQLSARIIAQQDPQAAVFF